jgi:hypothetical protein
MQLQMINLPGIKNMGGYNNNTFNYLIVCMKSLIKKKEESKTGKIAQCCAKTSRTVAGCHD